MIKPPTGNRNSSSSSLMIEVHHLHHTYHKNNGCFTYFNKRTQILSQLFDIPRKLRSTHTNSLPVDIHFETGFHFSLFPFPNSLFLYVCHNIVNIKRILSSLKNANKRNLLRHRFLFCNHFFHHFLIQNNQLHKQ